MNKELQYCIWAEANPCGGVSGLYSDCSVYCNWNTEPSRGVDINTAYKYFEKRYDHKNCECKFQVVECK